MPSLARSVPKPLKVPSLARSVPKPLKVPSLARSVSKPLKVPSLVRSVPKPLSIFAVDLLLPWLCGQPSSYTSHIIILTESKNSAQFEFWRFCYLLKKRKNKNNKKKKREQRNERREERIERHKEKGLYNFYSFGSVNPKFSGDNHPLSTPKGVDSGGYPPQSEGDNNRKRG